MTASLLLYLHAWNVIQYSCHGNRTKEISDAEVGHHQTHVLLKIDLDDSNEQQREKVF